MASAKAISKLEKKVSDTEFKLKVADMIYGIEKSVSLDFPAISADRRKECIHLGDICRTASRRELKEAEKRNKYLKNNEGENFNPDMCTGILNYSTEHNFPDFLHKKLGATRVKSQLTQLLAEHKAELDKLTKAM